jgi:isopropylmalate/homocitrate/citramalate synthase
MDRVIVFDTTLRDGEQAALNRIVQASSQRMKEVGP